MNRPFEVYVSQDKVALRRVLFAIELLDAVTLDRVSQGVKVTAHGLHGKPIVNAGGVFVWLDEDIVPLEKISIKPGVLPYEDVELNVAQLNLELNFAQKKSPLTPVELSPRVDYPFDVGITGLRGTLVEEHVPKPQPPKPVLDAEVHLRWLDQNGVWHDAPTRTHTTAKGGDFVAILRLAPSDNPELDASSQFTVRLCVKRDDDERSSGELNLPQGRVANPSTLDQFVFAWNELEP